MRADGCETLPGHRGGQTPKRHDISGTFAGGLPDSGGAAIVRGLIPLAKKSPPRIFLARLMQQPSLA